MVAAEAYPFMKVGGLADVIGSLPAALQPDVEVEVLLPWYGAIEAPVSGTTSFVFDGSQETARIGRIEREGIRFSFLDTAGDFDRVDAYGYDDDARRFIRFNLAAYALLATAPPDVLHLHDWQTGLLAALAREDPYPVVMTIHNLAYQGLLSTDALFSWTGLPRELHHRDGTEFHGQASLLKCGLAFADQVTTVSPTYAAEIQTPEFGCGLEGLLAHRRDVLVGIQNGIDLSVWQPPYGDLQGKKALEASLGLRQRPLGIVSRFTHQKGIDLAADAARRLVALGFSLAVLGSGDGALERRWRELAEQHPRDIHFTAAYDEMRSREIYAGVEALLIPSRWEPCGLTQMIAMRHGTIPIARAVGGLRDSIVDARNGFLFHEADSDGLVAAVQRFSRAPREDLFAAARAADHSWTRSARTYQELYNRLLSPATTRTI